MIGDYMEHGNATTSMQFKTKRLRLTPSSSIESSSQCADSCKGWQTKRLSKIRGKFNSIPLQDYNSIIWISRSTVTAGISYNLLAPTIAVNVAIPFGQQNSVCSSYPSIMVVILASELCRLWTVEQNIIGIASIPERVNSKRKFPCQYILWNQFFRWSDFTLAGG